MMSGNKIETDVLVVGGGGAGFRAAIGAREADAEVCLLSKGALARCGASPMAGADLTADGQGMRGLGFFGEPRDSKETFFADIIHQGCWLNDQQLTELYVRDAPDRLGELLAWGIHPTYTDERAIFTTGTDIMDALARQARRIGVKTLQDVVVLDLLTTDDRVTGALALDLRSGEFLTIRCKAVVIATGGWHKAFTPVTGSRELTGDGVAMAYRAGAELANMEFVTFCCNVLLSPPIWRGSIFPYVLSLVVGGGLINAAREAFLDRYDPDMVATATSTEWNKSFVSYATTREVREGKGTPGGGVYYTTGDMSWAQFEARAAQFYPNWRFKGADFLALGETLRAGKGVEVGAAAEYFPGGIAVDGSYATSVPGLYAAGECAVSPFGANRVVAATTEMLVAGAIAGRSAGAYAASTRLLDVDEGQRRSQEETASAPLRRHERGMPPWALRNRIQTMAQEKLGPIRTAGELSEFLDFLADVERTELPRLGTASDNPRYNKAWMEALDLANMVQVLRLSATASLMRTESRGVHFREDYPVTDNDHWLQEIVLQRIGDRVQRSMRPVAATSMTPPSGKTPYLEMLGRLMAAHSDIGGHH